MDSNQLSFIHDSEQLSSFNGARWKRGSNPDPVVISNITAVMAVMPRYTPLEDVLMFKRQTGKDSHIYIRSVKIWGRHK